MDDDSAKNRDLLDAVKFYAGMTIAAVVLSLAVFFAFSAVM